MTTQELIEKAEALKGSDLETLGRFAFDHLFEIIETLKKYREALEKVNNKDAIYDTSVLTSYPPKNAMAYHMVHIAKRALED